MFENRTNTLSSRSINILVALGLVISVFFGAPPKVIAQGDPNLQLFASNLPGPFGLAFDGSGNLFVANENANNGGTPSYISKITPAGVETIYAGGFFGVSGLAFNSAGVLHASDDTNRVFQIDSLGNVSVLIDDVYGLANPNAIAFDSNDNLYVLSAGGFVSKFDSTGTPIDLSLASGFNVPQGIVVNDNEGFLYIATADGEIFQVNMVTGNENLWGSTGYSSNGGFTSDSGGNFYLSSPGASKIIRIDGSDQTITTCVTGGDHPRGLVFDAQGILYFTMYNEDKIYHVDECGAVINGGNANPPAVVANLSLNQVYSETWPLGSSVTLTIDDASNGTGIDYTYLGSVGEAPWGDPNFTWVEFNLDNFVIEPNDIVTLNGNSITKELTVEPLEITGFNLDLDTIFGTAEPGKEVAVFANSVRRDAVANPSGVWEVDYSVAGSQPYEQTILDLTPGTNIGVDLFDLDRDYTEVSERIPDPRILSRANQDRIAGFDWSVGSTVTIDIDNPSTGQNPDKTVYATGGTAPWNPNELWFEIEINDYDLKVDDIVTATDGNTTKQLTIQNLTITDYDLNTELVHGTANPGQLVYIQACGEFDCANRDETADQNGDWTANFAIPGEQDWEQQTADLQGGTWLDANINDGDGDMSRFGLSVPNPTIVARLTLDQVDATRFPTATLLTLTVDDPASGLSPDYTATATTQANDPQDPNFGTSVNFYFGDYYTLKSGDLVTVTGGGFTRTTTVADIHVTNVDVDNNIVSGTAGAGITSVNVRVWSSPIEMQRDAEVVNGVWSADFSVPSPEFGVYDIKPGDSGVVRWFEGDGDFTTDYWEVPNPTFGVRANDDRVEGWQWPLGATVNVEIDDPATTLRNPDYSESTTVGVADWNPNETWFNIEFAGTYDIKIGDLVTVSDGSTTKQHTVVNLNFTQIETETERVFGTADSGQLVNIWTCWESDPCINRDETADSNGDWMTDFSIPGEQNWEQETADLRVGSWIDSSVNDEDGDATMYGVTVEAQQCQPGDTISGTVFEHDGTTPIPSITIQFEDFNTGLVLFTSSTNQNGQYGCSLPDGDYRVLAFDNNTYYSQEYFNEARDTNAALLQVIGGAQFSNVNFTLSPLPIMEHLTFNLSNPLLQELSVRQAIFLGTDRQEILNEAFLPYNLFGMVSNSIVPPEHWAAAPATELTLYPYNPTQAGAVLDAAGWINRDADIYRENPSGVELAFTFKTTEAPFRVVSAELFRQQMEQIGIRVTVETLPPSVFFGPAGTVVLGDFDIAEFAWGNSYDDETFLEPYVTGHTDNYSGYSNPTFDAVMANAASAGTEAEKLTYYYEAQAILSEDLPIVPYFTRQNVALVATPIGNNVIVSPESYLDINFGEVTDDGVTTVLPLDINPNDLPPNFQLLGQVYDIGTSASFTSAQVCFSYDDAGLTPEQESAIQLLHLENNSWVDVTDAGYPETTNNVVCGTVTSFSPFAVMIPQDATPPTITWFGNIQHGDSYYYGFVPAEPTCTASDPSGVDGACTVTGYSSAVGPHTLTATARDTVGNVATEYRNYDVLPWNLQGFYQPVDLNEVYNTVKGGSTVPLKFEVFAGSNELTDPIHLKSLTYLIVACNAGTPTDEIESTITESTGLRYDAASGQFIYNWKTPKNPGVCYRLTLTADDGSTLVAFFKLK